LQSVTLSSIPTAGSLRLAGVAVTAGQLVSAADLAAGQLVFTPEANANGAGYASFDFKVSDGAALSAAYTMTVNVSAVNDAPTASNRTVTTNEDTARILAVADFGFSDIDAGDTLQSVTLTSLPTAGSLRLERRRRHRRPVALAPPISLPANSSSLRRPTPTAPATRASASRSATCRALGSAYTMTVNVSAVNDAPTASNRTVTTNEDTARILAVADFGFSDVDSRQHPASPSPSPACRPPAASGSNGVAVTASQLVSAADHYAPANSSSHRRPTPTAPATRASVSRSATALRSRPRPTP
jgi:hypothetical protein